MPSVNRPERLHRRRRRISGFTPGTCRCSFTDDFLTVAETDPVAAPWAQNGAVVLPEAVDVGILGIPTGELAAEMVYAGDVNTSEWISATLRWNAVYEPVEGFPGVTISMAPYAYLVDEAGAAVGEHGAVRFIPNFTDGTITVAGEDNECPVPEADDEVETTLYVNTTNGSILYRLSINGVQVAFYAMWALDAPTTDDAVAWAVKFPTFMDFGAATCVLDHAILGCDEPLDAGDATCLNPSRIDYSLITDPPEYELLEVAGVAEFDMVVGTGGVIPDGQDHAAGFIESVICCGGHGDPGLFFAPLIADPEDMGGGVTRFTSPTLTAKFSTGDLRMYFTWDSEGNLAVYFNDDDPIESVTDPPAGVELRPYIFVTYEPDSGDIYMGATSGPVFNYEWTSSAPEFLGLQIDAYSTPNTVTVEGLAILCDLEYEDPIDAGDSGL